MKKLFTLLAVVPLACLAEVGPTDTVDFPAAQQTGPRSCVVAAPQTCKGIECPGCTVDISKRRVTARLSFPSGKLACVELVTIVPDNIDMANLTTIRFVQARISGAPGTADGGVCLTGQCAKITAQIEPIMDGMDLGNFTYNGPVYESDFLPGLGPNGAGKKLTGAIRNIDLIAAGLVRRNPAAIRLCRDARPGNLYSDNQRGTVAVENWYIVWPTVQSPKTP